MTKRLILMRHAKSDWDDPLQADIDRPLNERGRASAKAMGQWLTQNEYVPDAALVSSAARTRETFALLGLSTSATFIPKLYLAPPQVMWRALKGSIGDTVLMIAHNPGIAELAVQMLAKAPDHARFFDYPTAATLVCDFPINDWTEAVSRSGQVASFVVPKDLG